MADPIPLSHTVAGTRYDKETVSAYATARHGPDGATFLDPFFVPHLDDLNGAKVVDIGAGAGPWSVYAAKHGASRVFALDYQLEMSQAALKAVKTEDVLHLVHIDQADAAAVPYAAESFDVALSINVGCNLPNASQVNGR